MSELRQLGALPIKQRDDGTPVILLITSRERGRWIIPKGWPIEGKSWGEAAAVEAWEEAGVRGEVSHHVFGHFRYLKLEESEERKIRVDVYRLVVREEEADWPEGDERKRQWFTVDEALVLLDDRELAELIERERALLFSGLVI